MADRRKAVAEDLRTLATDLQSLLESATTDPKERQRKERQWRVLYGALGAVTTLLARRVAAKVWAILTGEQPPTGPGRPQPAPAPATIEAERQGASTDSASTSLAASGSEPSRQA
jgi:hypothetical protein